MTISVQPSALSPHPSAKAEVHQFLVGGVNSPVRAFRHIGGSPLLVTRAEGAEVIGSDGRSYLDFISGWGALLLGHNPPVVVKALREGLQRGVLFGLTHPAEMELAGLIVEAVPSVEQVRCAVSGTEACLTAVKLARAHTNRTKLVIFEGGYHGHGESLIAGKSAGIPEAVAQDVVTVPFNDLAAFEAAIQRHGDTVACVIAEPVAANMGVVIPEPGLLARIREVTRQHGIVLIFDEVVTGFRLGPGGAAGLFSVVPDLTVFGKIIGGGLPIGAVAGPRRIMQRLAPEGDVYHGGTFAGHPLSMAGGVAVLKEIHAHPPYERLEKLSRRLEQGLAALAQASGIPLHVNRVGSMLTAFFSKTPVRNFTQVQASQRNSFAQWATHLRDQGILIPPSPYEALFLSTAHTDEHVDRLLRACRGAFESMQPRGRGMSAPT